jgi:hypothetical protein
MESYFRAATALRARAAVVEPWAEGHTRAVMSRDLRLLERHFRHWRQEGLLTAQQESALRESSGELTQRSTRSVVRTALAGLGGGLLLAGLILIVAENWEVIHRGVKLGAWGALQVVFLLAAHHLGRAWPDRPALAEAFSFVAGGWMLGGIALVSQIYQLDSRPPNGIWLWLALVLPAAWLLPRRAVSAVVFVALITAFALEAVQPDSFLYASRPDGPWIWLGIPLISAGLVSWLPTPAPFLRDLTGLWTYAAANFFLLVRPQPGRTRRRISSSSCSELARSWIGRTWGTAGGSQEQASCWVWRCRSAASHELGTRSRAAYSFAQHWPPGFSWARATTPPPSRIISQWVSRGSCKSSLRCSSSERVLSAIQSPG